MEPGKRFEAAFKTCLNRLPGASMRIEDGGKIGRNRQWGDFFYWDDGELTYLFECKATHLTSFPNEKLKDHQLEALKRFDSLRVNHHSVLALNFYGESLLEKNRCILVDVWAYVNWLESHDRKSLPEDEAARIGFECFKGKDNKWDLKGALNGLYV